MILIEIISENICYKSVKIQIIHNNKLYLPKYYCYFIVFKWF